MVRKLHSFVVLFATNFWRIMYILITAFYRIYNLVFNTYIIILDFSKILLEVVKVSVFCHIIHNTKQKQKGTECIEILILPIIYGYSNQSDVFTWHNHELNIVIPPSKLTNLNNLKIGSLASDPSAINS